MKPILLSIQGLHSFAEEQTIDFERLCSRGLFGIFGPTGSGKSTILDGITLALYGKISRESKTFIHANRNLCVIRFTFQIGSSRYRVERRFKRDAKTGNSRNDSAILVDITADTPEVLCSEVRAVNAKCEELLGLSCDDFTRTVVLPQGKFSEFLKLEGKERRDMLERLFHLEEYGNELSTRLLSHLSRTKEKLSVLEGQLQMMADETEETYEQKQRQLQDMKQEYAKCKEVEEHLAASVARQTEQLQIQAEYEKLQIRKETLLKEEDAIEACRQKLEQAQKAGLLMPLLQNKQQAKQLWEQNEKRFEQLRCDEETWLSMKEQMDKELTLLKTRKDEELPALRQQLFILEQALADEQTLNALQNEMDALDLSRKQLETSCQNDTRQLMALQEKLQTCKSAIDALEQDIIQLAVSAHLRELVSQGQRWEEKLEEQNLLIRRYHQEMEETSQKQSELAAMVREDEKRLESLNQSFTQKQSVITALQQSLPAQEKLFEQKQTLLQEKQKTANAVSKMQKTHTLKESIALISAKLQEKQRELSELETRIEELERMQEQKQHQLLILQLRNQLQNDQPCPVCGSIHHPSAGQKAGEEYDEPAGETADALKPKRNHLQDQIQMLQLQLLNQQRQHEEIETELAELGSWLDEAELSRQETALGMREKQLERISTQLQAEQKELEMLASQRTQVDKTLSVNMERLKQLGLQIVKASQQRDAALQEQQHCMAQLDEIRKQPGMSMEALSFGAWMKQLIERDEKRDQLQKQLSALRQQLKQDQLRHDQLQAQIHLLEQQKIGLDAKWSEGQARMAELQAKIRRQFPEVTDLSAWQKHLQNECDQIIENWESAQAKQQNVDQRYQKIHEQQLSVASALKENIVQWEAATKQLQTAMASLGWVAEETISDAYLKEEDQEVLRHQIRSHESALLEVNALLEQTLSRHEGIWLTEEAVTQSMVELTQKRQELSQMQDALSKLDGELKRMEEVLSLKAQLLKQQETLAHRYGLLADLEKLFRGKKFVEFAAMNQLQYVAWQANDKLREMTSGNYGLEIDEEGKFLIRDYKNGGVAREVSTLSGGETFMASLSLALALSAQIQLKGRSPLELFFLDEGFGSLDEDCLDVVLTSLEQIHHDKLKIGLISHVESIKNRIPIKLIVTPAQLGAGGSKVHIELT